MRVEYERTSDLSLVGLTETDIANRGVFAVGYSSEELLPPYHNPYHEAKARKILDYLNGFGQVVTCATSAVERINFVKEFSGKKVVEVVGGYADFCVPLAVRELVRNDFYALVSSQYIFDNRPYADFTLGRILMEGAAIRGLEKCLIIGRERFLF